MLYIVYPSLRYSIYIYSHINIGLALCMMNLYVNADDYYDDVMMM